MEGGKDEGKEGLAYCMAIILKAKRRSEFQYSQPNHEGSSEDPKEGALNDAVDLRLHRKIVRALLSEGLKVGILQATEETSDKIVLVVDPVGVESMTEASSEQPSFQAPQSRIRKNRATQVALQENLNAMKSLKQVNGVSAVTAKLLREKLQIENPENMSASEEIVLANRMIQRALNKINVDPNGTLSIFDTLVGGERTTALEELVEDVFPLQDEVWNERFMERLRKSGSNSTLLSSFWKKWILQEPKDMQTEELRHQYGDRILTSVEFLLFYRKWLLGLTTVATLNYLIVRFSSFQAYLVTGALVAIFICCGWGPAFARAWSEKFRAISTTWEKTHILLPEVKVWNPNLTRRDLECSPEQRIRRRTLVKVATVLVVILNILVLAPVSLFFTQWYAYGKMSPTCECCEFFMRSGIGNGSKTMEQVPQHQWPEDCFETYALDNKYFPLDLRMQPEACSMWGTCFGSEAAVVGTDRWVYILIQGIAMGLILDVVQTALFKQITVALTNFEGHLFLEDFSKYLIRKQFFFIWVNMFYWYLTITFLYVPFGEQVQHFLIERAGGFLVPPWGFRPAKIHLDEAFVTPMVATAFINFVIDTFVPSLVSKLALKAKVKRRTLRASLGLPHLAKAAIGYTTAVRHTPRESDEVETERPDRLTNGNGHRESSKECSQTHISETLFHAVEESMRGLPDAGKVLHFFSETPDENKYDAGEIITQSVLPKFDENNEYLTIVLQMGYLSMFTSAWGLLPFAATIRLMFAFRGSCYKLLFACKRTVPKAALKSPGEWLSTVYVTFLLAIPVICAQFSLATGSLDAVFYLFHLDKNPMCGVHGYYDVGDVEFEREDVMMPDFKGCESLSMSGRAMATFVLEHICFGLFLLTYLQLDFAYATKSDTAHRHPFQPMSSRRRSLVAPLPSPETPSANPFALAAKESEDSSRELPVTLLRKIESEFAVLDVNQSGQISLADVRGHVHAVLSSGNRELSQNAVDDLTFSIIRLLQHRGECICPKSFRCTLPRLSHAYSRALADPLIAPFLVL